jgi:predicted lipid-binding transport protein (Tim44 family)
MRILMALVIGLYFLFHNGPELPAVQAAPQVHVPPVVKDVNPQESYKPEAYRMGGGGFRSGRSGYTGGTRSGVRKPIANNPANRTPAGTTGRFGGLFGGLLAGTLLGSLLNPFGFGGFGGGGFSLIGILFWGVILYFAYRLLRKLMTRSR